MPAGTRAAMAERLRDIEAVTDAALSRLDEKALLVTLLDRVKKTLQADTAAVLLLDRSARQLTAAAASGIEEEVAQGAPRPARHRLRGPDRGDSPAGDPHRGQ